MDILPTPQSRIEELMLAFITRDMTNVIQPQSRIEEYWYHMIEGTNSLPIPQSRVEILLKKIIENDKNEIPHSQSRIEDFLISILTGEIDELPTPKSRSELFLDYITRNNQAVEDVEYLSYTGTNITAYNTVEKPIKSAILKGNTLVNLASNNYVLTSASKIENGFKLNAITSNNDHKLTFKVEAKSNTHYTYIFNSDTAFEFMTGWDATDSDGWVQPTYKAVIGLNVIKVKTEVDNKNKNLMIRTTGNRVGNKDVLLTNFMLLEGDYTNVDIPYFEGMTSVKMPALTTTGKNLFDMNRPYDAITDSQATVVQDTNQITVSSAESGIYVNANFILDKDFFAGKTVTGSCLYESDEKDIGTVQIVYQDGNGEHHYQWIRTPRTFTFPNSFIGDVMLSVSANNTGTPQSNTVTVKNIQLELGSTATSYEPHKSNILTVNEDVTLRSNGSVYDELDLLTGKLTQRIDEDGSVLTQEVVKTVDLSIVNQDRNKVNKLSAFNDITHIISSSDEPDSLVAAVTVEVPTKLPESLINAKELSANYYGSSRGLNKMQLDQDINSIMAMSAMTELYELALTLGGDV